MTYQEAREFIDHSNQYGSKLGLVIITELLRRLGNPQDKLKIIHVAGTNGKGSTTAFITSILAVEGYIVGRYISPAVFSYRERIEISTRQDADIITDYITKEGVAAAIEEIKVVCDAMVREGFSHPTSFEIETAMAFLYFSRMQVDFAVIEVGLGGRLDATNVIKQPICSVITSISMDHMQFLGDTLAQIAFQKAGIIKKGAPVVTCNHKPEVQKVLAEVAKELGVRLSITSEDIKEKSFTPEGTSFRYEQQSFQISLLGEYQIDNAVLAVLTARVLRESGYAISERSISEGLFLAKWRGRFEIIARNPYFIIDGAHNEDAALMLKKSLLQYFTGRKLIFIMGVFSDKDYQKILQIMAPMASVFITITPNNSRALSSSQLAVEAGAYTDAEIIDAKTVTLALKLAYERATKEDAILAFGSLSYLGEILAGLTD